MEIESLKDYVYYSTYDFVLYDEKNDNIYYPKYYIDNSNFLSGELNEGEKRNSTIKYIVEENKEIDKLYLIYVDDENGVKIKL